MNIFDGKFRNLKCQCGSGKKFKKCCLYKFQGFTKLDGYWVKTDNNKSNEVKIV